MKMLQLLLKSLVKKVTLLWVQTLLDSLKFADAMSAQGIV